MEFKGVKFNESEIQDFQRFVSGSPGASVLNRVMLGIAQKHEMMLHDPMANLESLRFAQGALDALGSVNLMIRELMERSWQSGEDEAGSVEKKAEEEEEIGHVDF